MSQRRVSRRPRKKRSCRAVVERESVTDPESSKLKVISSVSLFLRLLSPFYGSPRSFFLPDRDPGQVHCLLDSVFLSFSFHFLPARHPALRSSLLFLTLSYSLFLSPFRGTHHTYTHTHIHLNLRFLGTYARGITPSRQFHSYVVIPTVEHGPGELLCQCQWHRSVRERPTVSGYQLCRRRCRRRVRGSLNRIPYPMAR